MTRPLDPRWRDLDWSAAGGPILAVLLLIAATILVLGEVWDDRVEPVRMERAR